RVGQHRGGAQARRRGRRELRNGRMRRMVAASGYFEHAADVGVRGTGETPEEAFAGAARALFGLVAEDLARVEPRVAVPISVGPAPLEELLAAFLNELIYLFDTRRLVFSRFDVRLEPAEDGAFRLEGEAFGEPYERS